MVLETCRMEHDWLWPKFGYTPPTKYPTRPDAKYLFCGPYLDGYLHTYFLPNKPHILYLEFVSYDAYARLDTDISFVSNLDRVALHVRETFTANYRDAMWDMWRERYNESGFSLH